MVGNPGFGHAFEPQSLPSQRVAAVLGLLLGLSLQCSDARAELLFRSAEQVNGQPGWSSVRKYSNPSDTAYARVSANGVDEVRVFLSGQITRADVDSVAVLESLVRSGRQKIAGNAVWFASNGGDIDAGMELGRRLRKLGVFTVIGKNDQCLSACVFAFMGGERRSVAGRLGIHRPYFPFTEAADRLAKFRYLETALKAFVAELDFPDSLYEAVMLVPPESMQIVAPADLKRFYLEGISPSTEDRIDAAAARRRNLSMFEYLKHKATAPACAFFDAGEGRCDGKVQEAAASGGMAGDSPGTQPNESAPAGRADSNPSGLLIRLRKPSEFGSRDPT
jgi:hypothetical protein